MAMIDGEGMVSGGSMTGNGSMTGDGNMTGGQHYNHSNYGMTGSGSMIPPYSYYGNQPNQFQQPNQSKKTSPYFWAFFILIAYFAFQILTSPGATISEKFHNWDKQMALEQQKAMKKLETVEQEK